MTRNLSCLFCDCALNCFNTGIVSVGNVPAQLIASNEASDSGTGRIQVDVAPSVEEVEQLKAFQMNESSDDDCAEFHSKTEYEFE